VVQEGAGSVRVLVAGGGTGGHLFPGIAVARAVLAAAPGSTVSFVGTAAGLEARVVPREGFALDTIRSAGLKGKSLGALARGLRLLPLSVIDAWRVLGRRAPAVVVGVGGYSSGPVVLLAWLRGIPTMVLEQNAMPGLTNRWLARVVDAAAVTYEDALRWFPRGAFVSGNPVREGFLRASVEDDGPAGGGRRLLVFGGSQGATAINDAMVAAAPVLARAVPAVDVTHQTGERDLARVRAGYRAAGLEARVEPFLHEMDREMARADLVVSRAGATTLAELTACGRPGLLVPLPTATDDHQRRNAEALARTGAAEVIEQARLTGDLLAARVLALLGDQARLGRMRVAARGAARPEAARVIAERVVALARTTRRR
jgi:UDP-N-acetylglucosamine--N-acetylmuramyl-(pentapeptide) pyrophosphoryl-undecaprenol N-acetylglucosamine transferase